MEELAAETLVWESPNLAVVLQVPTLSACHHLPCARSLGRKVTRSQARRAASATPCRMKNSRIHALLTSYKYATSSK